MDKNYKALLYQFLECRRGALAEWEFILCDFVQKVLLVVWVWFILFVFQLYITSSLMVLPHAVDGKGSQGIQEINLVT